MSGAQQTPPARAPPHLIFCLVDDLGYSGLGFTGYNHEVKTPTIDALAKEGVILDNHYTYKFCSPSRAAFLTGRIPGHGIQETNLGMTAQSGNNKNLTMIGRKLSNAGYYTVAIGKWHQGFFTAEYTPHGRGFNTSFGFLGGGEDHLSQCHGCENSIPSPDWATKKFACPAHFTPCGEICPTQGGIDLFCTDEPCFGRNTTANPYLYASEMTHLITEQASGRTGARALFVYLALHNVHQPVESPQEFVDLYPAQDYNNSNYARRVYNGMHSGVEFVVKNVTQQLKNMEMWNNSVFVLTGDNGGTFEHGAPVPGSSNFPYRGHKYSWFEGGCRTATFVASPLLPENVRGSTNHVLASISDWWATFAVLAGLPASDSCEGCVPVDGKDLWPAITGMVDPTSVRTELLLGVGGTRHNGALRSGNYKLIAPGGNSPAADGWSAQYPGTTHTIPAPPDGLCKLRPCLFDLSADPRETNDLSTKQSDLTAKLYSRYQKLAKELYAPNGDEDELVTDIEYAEGPCGTDICWELRSQRVQRARQALKPLVSKCASMKQLTSINWYDGSIIFGFVSQEHTRGGGAVRMNILRGCENCKFSYGEGTLDEAAGEIVVVAMGKGQNVSHYGTISAQKSGECRISWSSRINKWADFCQSNTCSAPAPPGPQRESAACTKMLSDGFWQPYCSPGSLPGTCNPL